MGPLTFFDCNAYLGLPVDRQVRPVFDASAFVGAMTAAGVAQALVWHIAQCEYSPSAGNRYLEEEIAPYENLCGSAAILPDSSHEVPEPGTSLARMKAARMAAVRAFPTAHAFFLDRLSCGAILGALVERRIPLLLSIRRGADYATVYSVLREYPELVCVLCDHSEWALDRQVPTLLEKFPSVHVDTTFFGLHGMIEQIAARFGAGRILFGSGFPEAPFASMVHEIRHADLSEEDRAAIAGGNLKKILAEADV